MAPDETVERHEIPDMGFGPPKWLGVPPVTPLK